MGALVTRRLRTRQPQQIALADPRWIARGLKFALLPSIGFVNLADGSGPLQTSGPMTVSATDNGVAHAGKSDTGAAGARAEFRPVSISSGLTIVSIWRSRTGSDYLGADGTPVLVSSRTSSNAGWSYGRVSAVGGTTNGNFTAQALTFQGVAQYTEANATIESRVDTPVACRYDPATNKISWFRFGVRSSADTPNVGTPSAGGNLVFGAQGDFASNGLPWIDRDTICLVFDQALSDAEIADLSSNPSQAIKAPARRLWLANSAAAGGSSATTVTGTAAGGSAAAGQGASVNNPTNIPSGSGASIDAGQGATVSNPTNIASGTGGETSAGLVASVSNGASVAANTGSESGTGQGAAVSNPTVIATGTGGSTDAGQGATVSSGASIPANPGASSSAGQGATVSNPDNVAAGTGGSTDAGQGAAVSNPTNVAAAAGTSSTSGQAATVSTGSGVAAGAGGSTSVGQIAAVSNPTNIIVGVAGSNGTGKAAQVVMPTNVAATGGAMSSTGLGATVGTEAAGDTSTQLLPNPKRTYLAQPRVREYIAQRRVREL